MSLSVHVHVCAVWPHLGVPLHKHLPNFDGSHLASLDLLHKQPPDDQVQHLISVRRRGHCAAFKHVVELRCVYAGTCIVLALLSWLMR